MRKSRREPGREGVERIQECGWLSGCSCMGNGGGWVVGMVVEVSRGGEARVNFSVKLCVEGSGFGGEELLRLDGVSIGGFGWPVSQFGFKNSPKFSCVTACSKLCAIFEVSGS
jgi:hypothetical protein